MAKKRHKWGFTPKRKTIDGGAVQQCKNCPCIREYAKGEVHYFLCDNIYYTTPDCRPIATH